MIHRPSSGGRVTWEGFLLLSLSLSLSQVKSPLVLFSRCVNSVSSPVRRRQLGRRKETESRSRQNVITFVVTVERRGVQKKILSLIRTTLIEFIGWVFLLENRSSMPLFLCLSFSRSCAHLEQVQTIDLSVDTDTYRNSSVFFFSFRLLCVTAGQFWSSSSWATVPASGD